jgi:hypothetical protein
MAMNHASLYNAIQTSGIAKSAHSFIEFLNYSVCSVPSLDLYSVLLLGIYHPCSRTCGSGLDWPSVLHKKRYVNITQPILSTPRLERQFFVGHYETCF